MSDKYDGLGLSEEEIAAMEEELGEDTGVEAKDEEAEDVTDGQEPEAGEAAKADADDAVTDESEDEQPNAALQAEREGRGHLNLTKRHPILFRALLEVGCKRIVRHSLF